MEQYRSSSCSHPASLPSPDWGHPSLGKAWGTEVAPLLQVPQGNGMAGKGYLHHSQTRDSLSKEWEGSNMLLLLCAARCLRQHNEGSSKVKPPTHSLGWSIPCLVKRWETAAAAPLTPRSVQKESNSRTKTPCPVWGTPGSIALLLHSSPGLDQDGSGAVGKNSLVCFPSQAIPGLDGKGSRAAYRHFFLRETLFQLSTWKIFLLKGGMFPPGK